MPIQLITSDHRCQILRLRDRDTYPFCVVCTEAGWSAGHPPGPCDWDDEMDSMPPCGRDECNICSLRHPARAESSGPPAPIMW